MKRLTRLKRMALRTITAGLSVFRPAGGPRDCIVVYHSVHPSRSFRTCCPDEFSRQLDWLVANCDLVRIEDLLESRTRGSRRPRVAIAFDDGYVDNYDYAFPVLRERGLAATFFVTAGYVDGDPVVLARFRKLWGATSAELQPLSWGQIREMADAGMEIGCHTYSHPSLRHLSEQDVEIELRRSKQLLEERLGRPIVGHAYPIGKPGCTIGLREAQAAEGLGYRYAVTAVRRAVQPEDSPWLLPRFSASFPLDEQIAGSWDWRGYYNERAPIWIARALSPRAFRASTYGGSYEEMRAALQAKST